jgi:hypothetical protein
MQFMAVNTEVTQGMFTQNANSCCVARHVAFGAGRSGSQLVKCGLAAHGELQVSGHAVLGRTA